MPLMDLWRSSPESISAYMIRQIVAISGDGRLRDESDCAAELRAYLAQVSAEKLSAYSNECLNDGFEDSGYVLQDVVNEVGRRLGFQVENGRYQGRQGGIGYDGIWRAEPDIALIAEVKTTDTYNVRLDAVADYREKLRAAGLVAPSASTLFVVGRKDTGALEAQIRGSRYAWDMRVVGVESLVKLMQIVVKSNERSTLRQIRELLRPFEYTRVDRIVDVVFGAATDVELAREEEVAPEADSVVLTDASNRTPAGDLENMRRRIIAAVSSSLGIPSFNTDAFSSRVLMGRPARVSPSLSGMSARISRIGMLSTRHRAIISMTQPKVSSFSAVWIERKHSRCRFR